MRTFERWSREGKIALHFTHLLFAIWSVTQAYADQEAQFALLLGKPALTAKDYEKGGRSNSAHDLECTGTVAPAPHRHPLA